MNLVGDVATSVIRLSKGTSSAETVSTVAGIVKSMTQAAGNKPTPTEMYTSMVTKQNATGATKA